ncbi:MAG: archaemetzincin family Zn-dependent metalloprotease [Syntrophobacteria bacterium]
MTNDTDPRPGVIICPLGLVDGSILLHLGSRIQQCCQVRCSVGESLENPAYAFDREREQHCCKRILRRLDHYDSPQFRRVLAVTEADLFIPILRYVFGAAQMGGRCAVVSMHRLRPQYYGDKDDQRLFLDRLVKTALHELGHSLGLTHCQRRTCVMYSSSRIQDTDAKMADFCPTCRELFRWRLATEMTG